MLALGLVANGILALTVRPLLWAEFLPPGVGTLGGPALAMLVLVPLLVVAAIAARRGTAGGRRLATLVGWSTLVVGLGVALALPIRLDRILGAVIALSSAVALWALGPPREPTTGPSPPPSRHIVRSCIAVTPATMAAYAAVIAAGPNARGAWLFPGALGRDDLRSADRRDLRGIDLSGADLHGATFRGADLRGADLHGARGTVDFGTARLDGADLHRATLSGGSMRGASLVGADLRDADLRHIDFIGADLRDADLRGADLRHANLGQTTLHRTDLRGAALQHSVLPHCGTALGTSEHWVAAICPDGAEADPLQGCRAHRDQPPAHHSRAACDDEPSQRSGPPRARAPSGSSPW